MEIKENGKVDKKNMFPSAKLTGWLSVAEINDTSRKFNNECVSWKVKAVTFCWKSKRLLISSINNYEQDVFVDSPVKSPGYESKGTFDNLSMSRSYPGSRQRIDSQTTGSFKQFISRKWSRTRNPGKLINQKSDATSPKSPSYPAFGSWKSQDSDNSYEEESAECIISLVDPDMAIIRPVHSSIFNRDYCFQLLTPAEMKYISCSTEEEYNVWLASITNILQSNQDTRVRLNTSLSIWVIEAKGVPARKQYYCEVLLDKVLFSRTSIKYKHELLFWGEQFLFDDLPPTESVTISLFRESETKKKRKQEKSIFVGSCVIDLCNIETNTEIEKWVSVYIPRISPKMQQKLSVQSKSDQPVIRTKFKYETTVVLPLASYHQLNEYLKCNYLKLSNILEVSIKLKMKDLLAQTLLKVLHCSCLAETFLVDLIMNEVKNTLNENLTFRGNSLATKSIDTYMKLIGRNYLQESLGGFIASVYESEFDAEVDPQKLLSPNTLVENQKYLTKLVEDAWKAIFLSVNYFPIKLQNIFALVRKRCETINRPMIVERIVSASLFLRFLCPAILSPSLFQLNPEYPNERVARCLTLVAKTLQNLANFTRFGTKESYMEILNEFVEREIPNMKNFLQSISYEPLVTSENENESKSSLNIDLARELSIIYNLLKDELAKITDEKQKDELQDLVVILNDIKKIYDVSPKSDDLRLSKPFATMADVCSKPLTSPAGDAPDSMSPTGTITPSNITIDDVEDDEMSYIDISLSLTKDSFGKTLEDSKREEGKHSLKLERRNEGSRNLAPSYSPIRTRNLASSSSPIRTRSANDVLDARVNNENKSKFEKLMSQAATNKSNVKQMKSEPVLTSIKKRQSLHSKHPVKVCKRESVKDRISMFSQSTTRTSGSPIPNDAIKTSPSSSLSRIATHSPTNSISRRDTASPSNSNLRMTSSTISPTKTLSPSPVNIELDSITNKPNVFPKRAPPIPMQKPKNNGVSNKYSPASQTNSTDRSWVRERALRDRRTPSVENIRRPSETKSKFNREQLKLDTLKREHRFHENKSPDVNKSKTTPDVSHSKTKVKSKLSNGKSEESLARSSSVRRNTITSDGRSSTGKSQVSLNTPLHEDVEDNTTYSPYVPLQEVHYPRAPVRRHSELTYKELERTNNNLYLSTAVNYGYVQSHSPNLQRNDSFLSSCSSDCSYSSECYSTDESYGIFIEGDNLSDAIKDGAITSEEQQQAFVERQNEENRYQSVTPCNGVSMDDYDVLQQKLIDTEYELKRTQQELHGKTIHFQNTVVHLKEKLVEADKKMKLQRGDTDSQMKNVIARLLNVESELRREHTEMETIIEGKEKIIAIQEKRISTLEAANNRLVGALSKIRQKYDPSSDDIEVDVTNDETSTSVQRRMLENHIDHV